MRTGEAVREVADYFDYSADRQGDIYLFRKRYSGPHDMPEVTPEECLLGLKAVTKLLTEFNPKYPESSYGKDSRTKIGSLLNSDQMARLGSGGLAVMELDPGQHDEVQRLALSFFLQSQADAVEKANFEIENRNPADPAFHWQILNGLKAFGYDTRAAKLNRNVFVPVSDSNRIIVMPDGTRIVRSGFKERDGEKLKSDDPTDPNTLTRSERELLDDVSVETTTLTLSKVTAALNRRAARPRVYQVDPAYAEKRITLVGADGVSGDTVMRAVAAIYGLRVAADEAGRLLLTHPSVPQIRSLADLGQAVRSVIPAQIYRAIQAGAQRERKGARAMDGPLKVDNYQTPAGGFYISAMTQFRYLAERDVRSRPAANARLSSLDERARRLFAFAQSILPFAQACWLADRRMPPYITDLDHVLLTGGLYRTAGGEPRFSLFFSYADPATGEMHKGVGFSNAPAP